MDECVNIEYEEVLDESVEPITKHRRMSGDAGRCAKQASKSCYGKKRKYQGHQHTKIAKRKQTTPVSERKVKCIYKQKMTGHVEGYRLICMGILQCLVSSLACPECHEKALVLEEDGCKKKGIPYFITVLCTECDYKFGSYTSKTVQPLVEGSNCTKPFEVNICNVSAFRSCGVGYTGLEKFCCMMNMPAPMTVMNYNNISNRYVMLQKLLQRIQ